MLWNLQFSLNSSLIIPLTPTLLLYIFTNIYQDILWYFMKF